MPNVRIIAKGQRGDSLTKLKVNFAPSQSSAPSLYAETNTVYLTRPTEGTGELMELVGGSVAWNQLVKNGNFVNTTEWNAQNATLAVSGGVATITPLNNGSSAFMVQSMSIRDHVYFAAFSVNTPSSTGAINFEMRDVNTAQIICASTQTGQWERCESIYKITSSNDSGYVRIRTSTPQTAGEAFAVKEMVLIDLTAYLGPTIADYVYSLEQATAGSGVQWLKSYGFFTEDYIPYSAPTLQSVEASAHVTKDANDTVIATYPLDSDLVLRGIPKLDSDNALYYDGDTYEWDGTVTRYYGTRAYQAGDESLTDAITDGTNTVYKLTTPTTESADPFTAVQTVEDGGTEEFTTSNGVPVGVKGRFANAVPMDGVDSFTVTANDGTVHTYPVTLSEEIYRGYVDMLTGEAVSEAASIAEYNGETINSPWLSSLDVYALGATPTRGAQVVYPITPEEVTATITGDPTELGKVTSASSTEGTVEWSAMAPLDGKCIVRVVS